jgi:hypothetical protein
MLHLKLVGLADTVEWDLTVPLIVNVLQIFVADIQLIKLDF